MPDFDQIEKDVVTRIRLLKAMYKHATYQNGMDAIVDNMYLPIMKLLAEFCACVKIGEEEDE